MSYIQRVSVSVTTDASGDATAYSEVVTGKVISAQYVKSTFDDGIDAAITGEATGTAIMTWTDVNASATVMPRAATHGVTGVAATYDGTRAVLEPVALAAERIKIVVAQGGNAKTGTFHFLIG